MRPVKRNFAPVKRKNVTLLYIMLYSIVPAKKVKLRWNTKKKIYFKHLLKIFIPKVPWRNNYIILLFNHVNNYLPKPHDRGFSTPIYPLRAWNYALRTRISRQLTLASSLLRFFLFIYFSFLLLLKYLLIV